ncbi:MAG: TonB-dependent receptor, partial [Alphaproteobacteria bacterium]|nr:TonB-dependent receptor [Alphaproteobacteria bacterium]
MRHALKLAWLTTAALPQVAYAQSGSPSEAQTQAAAAEPADPGDIIVTARRRAEQLQDVPISVTAISGEKLEESGVTDALSLQNSVPSLSTTTQGTTRSELGFAIRGQRTQESQLLTDAPVGTYFAEVVQARSVGFANT